MSEDTTETTESVATVEQVADVPAAQPEPEPQRVPEPDTDTDGTDVAKAQFEAHPADDEPELTSLRNEVAQIKGCLDLIERNVVARLQEIESKVDAGLRQYLGTTIGDEGRTLAERVTALEKKLKHS